MWAWCKERQRERQREQLVTQLLAAGREVGLFPRDYANAQEMLSVGEYGCAFDIVVQQLYECELEIPASLFALVKHTADSLLLTPGSYFFLGELVRTPAHVPVPVRREVTSLINSLQLLR